MISEFLLESLGAGIRFAQRRIEWDTSAHTFENEGIVFWFWNSPHFSNFFQFRFSLYIRQYLIVFMSLPRTINCRAGLWNDALSTGSETKREREGDSVDYVLRGGEKLRTTGCRH